jgi:hypothetical protein
MGHEPSVIPKSPVLSRMHRLPLPLPTEFVGVWPTFPLLGSSVNPLRQFVIDQSCWIQIVCSPSDVDIRDQLYRDGKDVTRVRSEVRP